MSKSNHNLVKILIISGLAFIMLLWLVNFNMSIDVQSDSKNAIDESSYFSNFEMDAFPSGTFSSADTEGYKVVVYNGWAPWCSACVGEMPVLEELSKEYKDKGLLVVGVVADYYGEKEENGAIEYNDDIQKTIDAYDITYPIVLADERFTEIVVPTMQRSFPTTWAVDSDGKLIEYFTAGKTEDAWREAFDKWLEMESED